MLMKRFHHRQPSFETESFDMTPIIDVVFLLIIFFMLVCQFIAAEQFQVQVPDAIQSAQPAAAPKPAPMTITILQTSDGKTVYAFGGEKLGDLSGGDLAELVRSEIDRVSATGDVSKTVRLRCDKSVTFGQVKYILSGISKSSAANLDWAVLGE